MGRDPSTLEEMEGLTVVFTSLARSPVGRSTRLNMSREVLLGTCPLEESMSAIPAVPKSAAAHTVQPPMHLL